LGGRVRFFEFGELRLAMLSLLSEGPKHGYQLMKDIEERSGGTFQSPWVRSRRQGQRSGWE